MKKIFFLILFIFFATTCAKAYVEPQYLTSVNHFGIGIAGVSKHIKIFEEDNSNSKIIQEIFWDEKGNLNCKNKNFCAEKEIFIAFSPQNSNALMSVEDENENWIFVCYNQKRKLFGWIKKDEETKFYDWREFLIKFGKKYGMYLFRDVPENAKRLYAGPDIETGSIDSFILATKITPWLIRGNWALVKVDNYDGKTKTGWLRWRSDTGRLFGFVHVN